MVPTGMNFQFEQLQLNPASFRWSLRVRRLEHAGHLIVEKNWQLGERQKIHMQFLLWLRSSVVRASDRHSKDPGSIPGGAALCVFFPSDPAVSSHLSDRKKRKEFD